MVKKPYRSLGSILLVLGTSFLAFLGFISIWGDIEAFVFNAAIRSEQSLSAFRCPAIITPKDDPFVAARISNPSDRELEMLIRTNISDGFVILMREVFTTTTLKPGESELIRVPINTEDAAYDRVVLIRMHQISRGSLPYRNASCGVIVFNIPWITGRQLVITLLGSGATLSIGALIILSTIQQKSSKSELINFRLLIGFVMISLLLAILGLQGWWLIGLLLGTIWLLLGVGLVSQNLMKIQKNVDFP